MMLRRSDANSQLGRLLGWRWEREWNGREDVEIGRGSGVSRWRESGAVIEVLMNLVRQSVRRTVNGLDELDAQELADDKLESRAGVLLR